MKNNSEDIKFLFISFCLFVIAYFIPSFIPTKISSGINDFPCEYTYLFSHQSAKSSKIIGIVIDEHSLNKIPQRWPWKRSIYAQAIKILDKEGVRAIGMDLTFVGESEDKEDDFVLKETLSSVSSRVVLAYFFDYKKGIPVLPLPQLSEACYALGMVNTPQDKDGMTRRLRAYIELEDHSYYSFTLALSAAFLNEKPQEIISHMPLLKDRTFYINYLLKPKDVIKISFFDVLDNLEELKRKYGSDFLKDSLVLIYPEAEIFHDVHFTPVGKMSGGLLHLNGVTDIILRRFIKEIDSLLIPLLIFSLGIIFYILRYFGFMSGILFTLGLIFFNFWVLVLLNLMGIKFDYSRLVIFSFLFFIVGSIYKYIHFLTQLLKIKDKATFDPLRNLFNLRYFYYRLELEMKKIYFHKDLILVFIYLESFQEAAEEISSDKLRDIWKEIQSAISLRGSFWSVYSQEELVGCVVSSPAKIKLPIDSLKDNLVTVLEEMDIKAKVKLGYLNFKKEYPVRRILFVLSKELKKANNEIILFKDSELLNLLHSPHLSTKEKEGLFLDTLDEDIEEKNRQLLSLIDNLNKEHAKTKEVFFEIITSLVNALEARDPYTQGHSQRVTNYALRIAEKLGWSKEEKEKLRKAALLHDLGKIGIPDSILHKRGPLNDEEFDFIKRHEIIAVRILEPLKEISDILPWILYHHERWDGKGYPHGLGGNAIPLASQIISLADVFDALNTGRDYKIAIPYDEAMKEIIKNKGTQFNPQLVDIFVEVVSSMQS